MLTTRLREMREAQGYTKKQVGEYLNMTPEGYGHYESGKRNPTPDTIGTLASLYGVTSDYLLGLSDDPNAKKDTAEVSDDDIMFALLDGDVEEITDEMFEEVKRYAKYIRDRKKDEASGHK